MTYPQFTEFNEAVQTPRTAFTDSELQSARVDLNGLGLPVALGGGFAYTYPMTTPRRKVAVRCFHRHVPSAENRYAAISRKLNALASPHFVAFDYQAQGIRIRGSEYPIVRMEWVDGYTLGMFLARHFNKANVLENLRSRFRALALDLQRTGIAHGDIQNDNVMLVGGELRLIDYDGMYVPPMQAGDGEEAGQPHWQHPQRTEKNFGPDMDRFSFIVVDLSLRALIADPGLYSRFGSEQNIIFKGNDYADPSSSEIFRILKGNPELLAATTNLERICEAPISQVPTLEDFLAGSNIPTANRRVSPPPGRVAAQPKPEQATYISAYPVLNAVDFTRAMGNVGNRVELVGRILAVKKGMGRKGRGKNKPFVFVNFGLPWTSNIVKLTAWSEGLANMSNKPSEAWEGKWVSVTGLVDVPYNGQHYGTHYTHVGITLTADGQVQLISESEARYRLGGSAPTGTASPTGSNKDILRTIGVKAAEGKRGPLSPAPTHVAAPSLSSNRDILNIIRGGGPPPQYAPPMQGTPKGRSGLPGWVWPAVIFAVVFILIYYAGR